MFRIIICHLFWEIWAKVRNFLLKQPLIRFFFLQQNELFFKIFHLLISVQIFTHFLFEYSISLLIFLTQIKFKFKFFQKSKWVLPSGSPLKKGRSIKISISIRNNFNPLCQTRRSKSKQKDRQKYCKLRSRNLCQGWVRWSFDFFSYFAP